MKIDAIEVDHQGQDGSRCDAVMKVDDNIAIQVQGFGSGEGRWKVSAQRGDPGTLTQAAIDHTLTGLFGAPEDQADGYRSMKVLGDWAVYLEPKTFAHAMWDVLQNA